MSLGIQYVPWYHLISLRVRNVPWYHPMFLCVRYGITWCPCVSGMVSPDVPVCLVWYHLMSLCVRYGITWCPCVSGMVSPDVPVCPVWYHLMSLCVRYGITWCPCVSGMVSPDVPVCPVTAAERMWQLAQDADYECRASDIHPLKSLLVVRATPPSKHNFSELVRQYNKLPPFNFTNPDWKFQKVRILARSGDETSRHRYTYLLSTCCQSSSRAMNGSTPFGREIKENDASVIQSIRSFKY